MKKIFLFICAAALMAVACNKSETVVREMAPSELGFRALSGKLTKAGEINGTILPATYGIYAAATQKNASGLIENASFFSTQEQLFAVDGESTAASLWKASPAVYWPIGGVKLDFLAYGILQANHAGALATGVWRADWDYASTDIARQVSFKNVDTYAHQDDVVYAVANDQTSAANGGDGHSVALTFDHAQALLIFNVKASVAEKIAINEISFVTPERVQALRTYQNGVAAYTPLHAQWEADKTAAYADIDADDEHYPNPEDKATAKEAWDTAHPEPVAPVLADLEDEDVTLKTVGTFTVNNERNILAADWSFGAGATKAENYKMKAGSTRSAANSASGEGCIDYGTAIANTADYTQLGETLLIPQQEKVNFTIKYTAGGNTMYYTVNDFRGVWEKGHKYLYNIDLTINEVVITETVVDYSPAATPVSL